ncbi:hypothetical protein J6590_102277 [Homalodisca vitripennis]|nr:hypothetical protein J6590_102277 [Homalodisca vitripennis]
MCLEQRCKTQSYGFLLIVIASPQFFLLFVGNDFTIHDGVLDVLLEGHKGADKSMCEVKANNLYLILNLGTNALNKTSEPPPITGHVDYLQGQD